MKKVFAKPVLQQHSRRMINSQHYLLQINSRLQDLHSTSETGTLVLSCSPYIYLSQSRKDVHPHTLRKFCSIPFFILFASFYCVCAIYLIVVVMHSVTRKITIVDFDARNAETIYLVLSFALNDEQLTTVIWDEPLFPSILMTTLRKFSFVIDFKKLPANTALSKYSYVISCIGWSSDVEDLL